VTDTTEAPEDPTTNLKKKVGKRLRKYFSIRRQRAELKLGYDNKKAKLDKKFNKADEPLAKLQAELEAELRALVIPNRVILMAGKLKSFATTFGSVSIKEKPESFKIIKDEGVEAPARKDGWRDKLGKFTRTWKPDAKVIINLMKTDPKAAKRYAPYVDHTGGFEEMFVKPNETYYTDHDPDRLTPKSVNLGSVETDSQDESPDA
jgi:phage host-nuclease inhibitor protein Gam